MGSYVVVRYALDHPDHVKKVLMVATATVAGAMGLGQVSEEGAGIRVRVGEKPDNETMRRWLEMLLYNKDRITEELVEARVRLAALPGAVDAQKSYRNTAGKSDVSQTYNNGMTSVVDPTYYSAGARLGKKNRLLYRIGFQVTRRATEREGVTPRKRGPPGTNDRPGGSINSR
jgi:pimeloyl-ACP methyl ester carboxylesterase